MGLPFHVYNNPFEFEGVRLLPNAPSIARAIHASHEARDDAGRETHLLWQPDAERLLRNPIEVGLRNVEE